MKLFLRVLPIALALMLPSVALAQGGKAAGKGHGAHAAAAPHTKSVKKPKAKAPKKPAKAPKVKATRKPSAPPAPTPKA
jgi:hypothetical protein